jgi:tetratricopeptide (TPR) repeat protein
VETSPRRFFLCGEFDAIARKPLDMPTLETTAKHSTPEPKPTENARAWPGRLADFVLGVMFLSLVFLLGMFPLKDTDFWWHLRTGDLIRETFRVPVTDWYTFAAADHPWIDLHWGFEVLLSIGYELGGVVALNLAKCVVTTVALLILLGTKRKGWPLWAMIVAWLPALFVLSGRMYVRPETLSLLFLAIELAILFHWKERPRLAFGLPVLFLLWVNSHGLFVVGLVVLVMALADAAWTFHPFDTNRRPWWRTVLIGSGLAVAATVVNPYGVRGALFPLELARTMANPIFASTIAELTPVGEFIRKMGLSNVPLRLHLLAMLTGALSFLIPLIWQLAVFAKDRQSSMPIPATAPKARKSRRKTPAIVEPAKPRVYWALSPFRLFLYAGFTLLGWKATRNTHQFAAVVGAVTAWNFSEWVSAIQSRRAVLGKSPRRRFRSLPKLATFSALTACLGFVAGGGFYTLTAEGRTIGLGEEPRWFPHEAARRAGADDMPKRFICFHNGHAGIYEYYNGPAHKVMADARLEVIGPEVYGRFLEIEAKIRDGSEGWREDLAAMENPGILVDNVHAQLAGIGATLFADSRWVLVHFDPIAALFVPDSSPAARRPVDFTAEHFRSINTDDSISDWKPWERVKPLSRLALALNERRRDDAARPLMLLGASLARQWRDAEPKNAEAWKSIGLFESLREPLGTPEHPVARYLSPFDPVFDLSPSRAVYALREGLDRDEQNIQVLLMLASHDAAYGLNEAAVPILERMASLDLPNLEVAVRRQTREGAKQQLAELKKALGPEPPTEWKNMAELDDNFHALLNSGRVGKAADLLESAYPVASRPWDVTDRLATLRLHLGRPDLAKAIWDGAISPPRPALRKARVAAAELVFGDTESARRHYREALKFEPKLFEAHYGLAVLERDDGNADAATTSARRALEFAPNDVAKRAAKGILEIAAPFSSPTRSKPAVTSQALPQG